MSVDRSLRSTFAAVLLVAALFITMNRVVASAPLADWFLPLILFIIGAALVPNWNFSRGQADTDEEEEALPANVRTYRVAAQQVPRLQTMTIRPDPEISDTVVTVTEDTPGDLLPFIETETAYSVPSAAKTFTTPDASLTSASAVQNTPAPAPSATSHNEAADPGIVVAKTEAPVAPAPDDSVTATPREPEKEVIAEKTAAPQQPYEAAQIGAITPEQVDQVMNDSPAAASPLVSETASDAITAQERDGVGTVGSGDDLTKLNGIGPKSAAALKAAGIDSYHKLANASEDQIRAAVAGVRLVGDVSTWARQASYAAQGDWAGLDQFKAAQRKTSTGD